ncbi:MAG: hypothetical protein PW786_09965 [Arachidicoccus sp.]|nr:hypothetical protein [Arachidicoccus sp.]
MITRNYSLLIKKFTLKSSYIKYYLPLLLLCMMANFANAQKVTVTLDRNQILLGQQVALQLKLDNVNDEAQTVSSWFKVPDTGNHVEVISRGKIDTADIDGSATYIQKIIITSFDSGAWTVPVIAPVIKDKSGFAVSPTFDSVSLQVMPVDVSNLKDYHPAKDIIRIQYHDYTWIYYTLGALLTIIIIFLIVRWWMRRKPKVTGTKTALKGTPLERALKQIDLLEKENLIQKGEGKTFFTKLDEICRNYFDERTHTHTLQSTSVEMMDKLRAYLIREKDRIALQQFARLSDVVKFAKYKPEELQGKEAIATAKETIQNIEKEVIDRKQKNAD